MRESAIRTIIEPVLAGLDLELDRLEVIPAGRRSVVRVSVDGDGPQGLGPRLDEIADATRAISQALDDSGADGSGPYTLEVSSRGVGRPLTEPRHFRRNLGRLVAITLADGHNLTGRMLALDEQTDTLTLEVTPEPTKQVKHPRPKQTEVALDQIAKAVVQVELNRPLDADLDTYSPGADAESDDDTDDPTEPDEDDDQADPSDEHETRN